MPPTVTRDAVRSYRTFSPLPAARKPQAVCFLWHFPWAHAPQALPGTLPCEARTFLRFHKGNSDCLADSETIMTDPVPIRSTAGDLTVC